VRLAFDSRPAADEQGLGRYSRCLLQALRDTAGEEDEIVESHRPRGADVFHTPWVQGALLHSPCPMVVTLHDFAPLRRPSERLRCGGMHLGLRHLALQRAMLVIVPTDAAAEDACAELGLEGERLVVIPDAPAHGAVPRGPDPATVAAQTLRPAARAWSWEDAARATWRVYRQALAQPEQACVTGWSRRQGRGRRWTQDRQPDRPVLDRPPGLQ
jgi:hypothetical protein